MEGIVRTIYSGHLMTCKMMNRPFSVLPNSTLNQKFNLNNNELPALNEYPVLGYIALGNKGASYEITGDGYVLTTPIPHLARDAALYNHIPFIVRNINDDISPTERLKYRLRVPITIQGTTYVAYYLRRLSIDDLIPTVELRNVENEVITTNSFTPTLSDLSPTPPNINTTDISTPNGDYLASTAKVDFVLGQTDINEIMDACALIYGDARYAVINEIALCSGIDRIVQGTFGAATSNYTDCIATQVNAFIYQYHALTSSTTEVKISLDIGTSDPLFV